MVNKKSREYTKTILDRPVLVYDEKSHQGNWHVRVEVYTDHHRQPIQGGPITFDYRSRTTLEVPTNGPGVNKAKRKLNTLLERLGLPKPKLPLMAYEGEIPQKHSKSRKPLYLE